MLRVFEAFAGYGSQRMALRNLGIEHEVVAISEFDKYADASYQAIHGETWNMGDITKIDVDDVPDHDLFTYSFPCQDISVAGKGKGFSKDSGTRSGLLWESERIIKAKKPKYLLMENVKNLISEKFMPGFVEWILALEELGYSNYYEVLNAKDFGIPQNRERVFMVSILGEHEPYVFPKPIKLEKRLKDVLEDEVDEKYYLNNEKAEQLIATITEENNITNPTVVDATVNEPKTKEIMNTIIARYDAGIANYKSVDGAVIEPKIAASRGRGKNNEQQLEVNKDETSNALTTVEKDNYVVEPKIKKLGNIYPSDGQAGKVYDPNGISVTVTGQRVNSQGYLLTSVSEGIPIKNNTDQGYLIAKDGDGVDLAYPTSNTRRGRVQENISQTLTTDNSKGVVEQIDKNNVKGTLYANASESFQRGIHPLSRTLKVGSHDVSVTDGYRIRKLTPLECFRLMDVTDEDFYKAQAVNSNSQLYKQAGNSIVVSVLEAIFRNMFLEVPEEDLVGEHIPLF